jgi:two-component system, cell cycle response regulator DivK
VSKAHVLIIDDNIKNVNVLANLLDDEDISHTEVTNPHRLEQTIESIESVNIVFLDLEMPGIDGYQVLSRIRSDERFAGVPVVAYTVHVSEIHTASQSGFNGFIAKPIDPDRFPDQIARLLRGEPVWNAS